ncbi:hypothetical protein BH23ACT9_BH23ACT9_22950 [soil metagenome]
MTDDHDPIEGLAFEEAVRAALARETAGVGVSQPDPAAMTRDARRGPRTGWVLTAAACLLLLGVVTAALRLTGGEDPQGVVLDGGQAAALDCDQASQRIADVLLDFVGDVDIEAFYADPGQGRGVPDAAEPRAVLAEMVQRADCDEATVRRGATTLLIEGAIARFPDEELQARQTLLSSMLIFLVPEDFGLGSTFDDLPPVEPRPATTATAPGQPTPVPTAGPSTAWCGERGLVGAAVSTAGALVAMCTDGTDVIIDEGPGYVSVDIGGYRLVAERTGADGQPEVVQRAIAGAGFLGTSPGRAPAMSTTDRLAWVRPDGSLAVDQVSDGQLVLDPEVVVEELTWDRGGRWLFATTTPTADTPRRVLVYDTLAQPGDDPAPPVRTIDNGDVLAIGGEIDTPDNVVLLVRDSEGRVRLDAAFVGAQGGAPFGLATPDLPPEAFTGDVLAPFVEPVGLLDFDPSRTPPWAPGGSIAWIIGDGTSAWYVDGVGTTLVRSDVRDIAVIPAP